MLAPSRWYRVAVFGSPRIVNHLNRARQSALPRSSSTYFEKELVIEFDLESLLVLSLARRFPLMPLLAVVPFPGRARWLSQYNHAHLPPTALLSGSGGV